MKNKDLRIGNKLQKDNGEIFTVLRIDNTNDVLVEEQRGLLTLGYNLFGIPLTKEWLLKFGFVKRIRDLPSFENKNLIVEWLFKIWTGRLYYDAFTSIKIIEIKYVHQLQNLYFALTGKELTSTEIKSE